MSLEATFWIDSALKPAELQQLLVRTGFAALPQERKFLSAGSDGILMLISQNLSASDYLEEAGIAANLQVHFICTDKEASKTWTENVFRAVGALLREQEGDALLIYAPDYPALLRKSGELILDERRSFWSVETGLMSYLPSPSRLGIIPLS